MTREYLVVYEKTDSGWSGFSPDVPGCVSAGKTPEETHAMMREALESHFAVMVDHGEAIPEPVATAIDFTEFDPGHETKQYMVEWLCVSLPQLIAA
jgi:predicted RNase H-like HicB family nuclease